MHSDLDDFEPVVTRLRSVRQQPLDHALAQRVLARANRSRLTWLRATKLKVAAALVGGFMIGSVSLASAGALPGQAQDVAHAALGVLGVDVPPGHDRYNGPECGDVKNHGEYVEAHPDDPAASKSPCGKPNRAVDHPRKDTDPAGTPGKTKRHGPPPWAGQGKGVDKDKVKDKDNEDSQTPEVSTATTATVADAPSTTSVAEVPSTTTGSEPTATTTGTSDSDTSTTTDSTTSTVMTTVP